MADENAISVSSEGDSPEEWKRLAWRLWLHGIRDYKALGKRFRKDQRTVKKAIIEQQQSVREELKGDDWDALVEYLEGLYEDLRDADHEFQHADNSNARMSALKHRTLVREKIAAGRGIATERAALEVMGAGGEPMTVVARILHGDGSEPPGTDN